MLEVGINLIPPYILCWVGRVMIFKKEDRMNKDINQISLNYFHSKSQHKRPFNYFYSKPQDKINLYRIISIPFLSYYLYLRDLHISIPDHGFMYQIFPFMMDTKFLFR